MKNHKTPPELRPASDELRPEYAFDPTKGRTNNYAGRISRDRVVVLLDADVSRVFTTSESVNAALRALIAAMPASPKKSRTRT